MIRSGVNRFRVLTLREIGAGPGRSAAVVLVIAVSAALLVAVLAIYGSLTNSVRQLTDSIAGDARIVVSGYTDTGFDMAVVPRIAGLPGVGVAAPIVQQQREINGLPVTILGVDVSVLGLGSDLGRLAETGLAPSSPLLKLRDGVVAGAGLGVAQGERLRIGEHTVTVAVVAEQADSARMNGGRFIVAPLPLAQRITDHENRVDTVAIATKPDTDPAALRTAIVGVVDNRAVVSDSDIRSTQAENAVAISRDSTLLVAAISLVVAAFLVYNSMTMLVMQRRQKVATLRAMGARRSTVVADLVLESVATGLVAAAIGIPLGWLLSRAAIEQVPAFLVQSVSAHLVHSVPPLTYPIVVVACVLASVAATVGAARQVRRISPLEALQSAELASTETLRSRWTVLAAVAGVGLIATAFGLAVLVRGPAVFLSVAVYTVGGILLGIAGMSRISTWASILARRFGAPGRLAAAAIERAPRRSWATAVTAGIAVALGIGVHGALADVIDSGSHSFVGLRATDVFISSSPSSALPTGATLPDDLADRVRAVPGIGTVGAGQWAYVTIGEQRVAVEGLGTDNSGTTGALMDSETLHQVRTGTGIAVSRQMANREEWEVGSRIDIGTPTGLRSTTIIAIMDILSIDSGTIAMSVEDMRDWFDRPGATYLSVSVAAGADRPAVMTAIERIARNSAYVYSGEESYNAATHNIRQAGVLAGGLQWTVALVAAVALLNTFTLAVLQRRRELGVLRAMGATRRLISRFILVEAFSVGVIGGVLGLALGIMVQYLATLVSAETLGVAVRFTVAPSVLGFAAIGVLICLLGAAVPAVRAARMNIVTAIWSE
ncbi:FtsX-like permease family protein [Nocardia alba]|uniref:Putative ABC transport system permease protein n=1 Tax=Nocardia alba TaxID=225051 RepID=A0A4R1FX77_9NOCA|nr:FtsX-like permease family protein [Nocardia alba]TCJ97368.1 putative ABC transport system permease protein [Nocardia alba]